MRSLPEEGKADVDEFGDNRRQPDNREHSNLENIAERLGVIEQGQASHENDTQQTSKGIEAERIAREEIAAHLEATQLELRRTRIWTSKLSDSLRRKSERVKSLEQNLVNATQRLAQQKAAHEALLQSSKPGFWRRIFPMRPTSPPNLDSHGLDALWHTPELRTSANASQGLPLDEAESGVFTPLPNADWRQQSSAGDFSVAKGEPGLVSIVLPVYNHADLLAEAIQGVLVQTYKHWELIIVDDGSRDGFDAAIRPFLNEPRIRVFRQINQRLPSALNNGFRHARGEFYTWTSADNIMEPQQIEYLVDALRSSPTAGLAYSDYEAIDDRGEPLGDPDWRRHNRPDQSAAIRLPATVTIENFHTSGDNFLGASFLWRADVHSVVGSHDENTFGGEDYDFWLRMHVVTPFVHVSDLLYKYRVHDNSLNAKAAELRLIDNVKRLLGDDRDRRQAILVDSTHVKAAANRHYFRDVSQYQDSLIERLIWINYAELEFDRIRLAARNATTVLAVIVDVPIRLIDAEVLSICDIVLVPDETTYHWLRRQQLAPHLRVFAGSRSEASLAVQHAAALRSYERTQEVRGHILASKPPAFALPIQRPKHVMQVVGSWAQGGIEQVVLELSHQLRRTGSRVTLASADQDDIAALKKVAKGTELEIAAFGGSGSKLASYAREYGVDVVNFHHTIKGAAELSDSQIARVYTFHNSYIWFDDPRRAELNEALLNIDAFVSVSRQVAEYAAKWFGVPAARSFVIDNGTDIHGLAANAGAHAGSRSVGTGTSFLHAGTFNRVKCQDRLLRAFSLASKAVPDISLTLVGAPADQKFFEEVQELRVRLGIGDRVTILPGVDRDDVIAMMRLHDCFVLPSLVEGCSIGLMEAAIVGKPIIATDVGNARELARRSEGVSIVPSLVPDLQQVNSDAMWGILNSPSDRFERHLADAMQTVTLKLEQMKFKSASAAADVAAEYSIENMSDRYINCYREALIVRHAAVAAGA